MPGLPLASPTLRSIRLHRPAPLTEGSPVWIRPRPSRALTGSAERATDRATRSRPWQSRRSKDCGRRPRAGLADLIEAGGPAGSWPAQVTPHPGSASGSGSDARASASGPGQPKLSGPALDVRPAPVLAAGEPAPGSLGDQHGADRLGLSQLAARQPGHSPQTALVREGFGDMWRVRAADEPARDRQRPGQPASGPASA